jgi:hypothetical protein
MSNGNVEYLNMRIGVRAPEPRDFIGAGAGPWL